MQTTHAHTHVANDTHTHPSLVCASPRAYLCVTIHLVRPQHLRSRRPRIGARARLRPLHRHCCGLNPRHGGGGGQARERGGTGASEFPPRPPIGQEPGGGGSPSARFAVAAGRWPSGRAGPGARAGCGSPPPPGSLGRAGADTMVSGLGRLDRTSRQRGLAARENRPSAEEARWGPRERSAGRGAALRFACIQSGETGTSGVSCGGGWCLASRVSPRRAPSRAGEGDERPRRRGAGPGPARVCGSGRCGRRGVGLAPPPPGSPGAQPALARVQVSVGGGGLGMGRTVTETSCP